MTDYQFIATNFTAQGWHVALYQDEPQELGLHPIAWRVLTLSKPQGIPTTGTIRWTQTYQLTVLQTQDGNVYTGGISAYADVGGNYELFMSEDGYHQIREIGGGTEGYISFINHVKSAENMGLMLDRSLITLQENVSPGAAAQFKITPTYYCGFFTNLEQGSFVSSDAAIAATKIQFPANKTTAAVSADIHNGQVVIKGVMYS